MAEDLRPAAGAATPTNGPGSVTAGLIRTARPKQWVKNVLVFAAPGAAGVLTHGSELGWTLAALGLFCAVASGTYLLNDCLDAPADRRHPDKRHRPVAAGIVPVPLAATVGAALLAAGVLASLAVTWRLTVVLAIYVAVQAAYGLFLKHQPVYDLACVASGFVLRAIAGGVAAHVPVSDWFLIVATFGSLLMVTGKRLAEKVELGPGAGEHRSTLAVYTPTFLRIVLAVSAAGAMLAYCLWALSIAPSPSAGTLPDHGAPLWYHLSIVPMLLALLRYTFLVDQGRGAKPEDLVFSDPSLPVLGAIWVVLFALGVYAG